MDFFSSPTEKALKQKTSCGRTPTPGPWPPSTAPSGESGLHGEWLSPGAGQSTDKTSSGRLVMPENKNGLTSNRLIQKLPLAAILYNCF